MREFVEKHLFKAMSNLARELDCKPAPNQIEGFIRGLLNANPALKEEYLRACVNDHVERFPYQ